MVRLATIAVDSSPARPGLVVGEQVIPLGPEAEDVVPGIAEYVQSMRALIAAPAVMRSLSGPEILEDLRRRCEPRPIDEVRLLAPVPDPGKIIGVGLNYLSHADEAEHELPKYPMLFAKFRNTVAGPHDDIRIPRVTHRIDYEGELAVIIGTGGRYIDREVAMEHVAGLTIANDVSARDYQFRTREMLSGKSFDGFAPMGPWMTTTDEVGDIGSLRLRTWVNGEQRQDASISEMVFSIDHLVSYVSDIMTLEPGDILLTGTPSGIGATLNPRRWLRAGDVVRIEVSGIGQIQNRVVEEQEA